jgi:cellobiose-specific phosphotransferase system component IIB
VKAWIEEKNLKAFSFYHRKDNYKSVDIVLVHPLDFEKAFANKTVKSAKEIVIYVASIDDIIYMKEWSGRKQDLSDAALLRRAKELRGKSDE